jgi:hypothetical protein
MRILLDECVPQRLRAALPHHDVRTASEMSWSGKKNGELLRLMVATQFDILLTVDQNLQYQQNVTSAGVAVILLSAAGSRLADLLPLMPSVEAALVSISPGDVVVIRQ